MALPKFISPRNPFASEEQDDVSVAVETSPGQTCVLAAASAKGEGTNVEGNLARRHAPLRLRVLGALKILTKKINPLARWGAPAKAKKPAIPVFSKSPLQAELSLDQVKVVSGDLSDADLDVVPLQVSARTPSKKMEEHSFVMAGVPADRVATPVFGPNES